MTFLLVWIFSSLWAGHAFGLWGFLLTFVGFIIIPVVMCILTLAYMEKHKIDSYRLDLFIIAIDLERDQPHGK